MLRAQQEKGPHRHIPHPDMRTFWFERYNPDSSVPMEVFMQDITSADHGMLERPIVDGLKRLLTDQVSNLQAQSEKHMWAFSYREVTTWCL